MQRTQLSADEILLQAKIFKIESKRRMNYNDYERFKSMLIENGHWNYEQELAKILEV